MAYSFQQIDTILREICGRIAAGQTLNQICEPQPDPKNKEQTIQPNPHLPRKSTVMRWLNSEKKEFEIFRDRYRRARVAQSHALAEEILDVGRRVEPVTAHADRVRIEALKWVASKLNQRDYGDHQHVSLDAKVEQTSGPEKAPEWMQERLADAAAGASLGSALRGKPEDATSH